MIIINADDFGVNEEVNHAILAAFQSGLCSSTTLMATTPGFEHACELAHSQNLLQHVGMHLVLKDSRPLTSEIQRSKTFCDSEGNLCFARAASAFILSWSDKRLLAKEIRAQIQRCRQLRIPLTHVDSHHHTHTHWAVLRVLLPIVRSEGIRYVRIARNFGANLGGVKKVYKSVINYQLFASHLAGSRYFGSIQDYMFMRAKSDSAGVSRLQSSLELMIHPISDGAGNVVNGPGNESLGQLVQALPFCKDAVSFTGFKYA